MPNYGIKPNPHKIMNTVESPTCSNTMLPSEIVNLDYSEKQRLFHFDYAPEKYRSKNWTTLKAMSLEDAMKFCEFMDKKYVNGRASGILPELSVVKLEMQLFFKLKNLLPAGKMKFCDFQVTCNNCFEIIYLDKYFVAVLRNGQPLESELKRVFAYPEFQVEKPCPCCGKTDFTKDYGYEAIPVSDEDYFGEDEDDLPF